jgi:hypothetical protein|tara:strand:- start:28 stop:366 length:339 start_codon:yes stop_codon:yes gene_type:complete
MATSYDFNITQGSEFYVRLTAKNADGTPFVLSGYNTRGSLKWRYSETGSLVDLGPTTVDGYLQSGWIDIKLTAAQTSGLPVVQGVYDVEIYSGTYANRLIYGKASIIPEVTT